MFNTIRSVLVQTKLPVGKASAIVKSVRTGSSGSGPSINNQAGPATVEKIQHSQEPPQKGDVMSHSFGDGYSTRSDEEGFGGTFSGNESLSDREQEKIVHANAPEYDKSQGSTSAEKEEGRNQP